MERLNKTKLNDILEYLRKDIPNCLYMYIDIAKYGIDNENIDVWYDVDIRGNINVVIMKYFNSLSIYSEEDDVDSEKIIDLINLYNVPTINAKKTIIKAIESHLKERYIAEYGYVFKFKETKEVECEEKIENANLSDMKEIANLICKDLDFGAMYNADDLEKQLSERIQTGFGRSYIIKKNGKIIAHIASYAEFNHIATTSGLVVEKEYQNGVYGLALERYLVQRLLEDGFEIYTFVIKKLRKKFLEVTGNIQVGEYGKLIAK